MSGGIYEGPDGEKLYGDGREVSPVSGKPIGSEAAMTREKLAPGDEIRRELGER